MNAVHRLSVWSIGAAAALVARGALADDASTALPTDDARPDVLEAAPPAGLDVAPRPWVYLDDPTLPQPLAVTGFTRATYTGFGSTPTRPFGGDLAHPGGVLEFGAEAGLTSWMSIAATGFASSFVPAGESSSLGGTAALRFAPFASRWKTTHLVASVGYLREMTGGNGAWARVSLAQDAGRLRVGTTLHGEHVFSPGRDGIDVMAMAGASYRVAGPFRAGVEYVAQDLEGAFDPQEVEGMRHFLGPTMAFELLDNRLSITGGPSFGLTSTSPPVVGRLGVAYAF
jgi:hypothetical protein